MAIVKLFNELDVDFSSDGERIIAAIRADVYEDQTNGDFYLELEVNEKLSDRDIIAVWYKNSWQGFRLGYHEVMNHYVYYHANHVFYDTLDYQIKSLSIIDTLMSDVLPQLQTTSENPFTITTDKSSSVNLEVNYNSLHDVIMCLVKNYNCFLVRDNYNIFLADNIIEDKEIEILDGKNLINNQTYSDSSNLVTELYPIMVFRDTEYHLETEPLISNIYDKKYTRTVRFTPSNLDYFNILVQELNDIQSDVDDMRKNIEYNVERINQALYKISDTENEINQLKSETADLEAESRAKFNSDTEYRHMIIVQCRLAINEYVKRYTILLAEALNNVRTYESQLDYVTGLIENNFADGKVKATMYKPLKGPIVKNPTLSELKKQKKEATSKLKTWQNKLSLREDKLEKFIDKQTDFINEEEISAYDVENLNKLLAEHKLKQIMFIADMYVTQNETQADREKAYRDIERIQEQIYRGYAEIGEYESQISAYESENSALNTKINLLNDNYNTKNAFLLSEIRKDLSEQGYAWLNKYKYPQVNYQIGALTEAEIGNKIVVKDSRYNINIDTYVVAVIHDCLLDRHKSVQFGNTGFSMKALQQNIINSSQVALDQKLQQFDLAVSNMQYKLADLDGYVTAIQNIDSANGQYQELYTALQVANGLIQSRVTKQTVDGVAEAVQTIMHDEISQKVSKNNVISEINQTAEEIKILASKLSLTAQNIIDIISGGTAKIQAKNISLSASEIVNIISSETVKLQAKNIDLSGYITANGNTKFNPDGTFEAINAKLDKVTVDGNIRAYGSYYLRIGEDETYNNQVLQKIIDGGWEYGFSGEPYVQFGGQYAGMVWVPGLRIIELYGNEINIGGNTSFYNKVFLNNTLTTTSAVNMRCLDSTGEIRLNASSSIKYKKKVKTEIIDQYNPNKLYDVNVVQFEYQDGYLSDEDDRKNIPLIGFIVEDLVNKGLEYIVDRTGKNGLGEYEMWNDHLIIPMMVKLLQDQHQEDLKLKKELERERKSRKELEKRVEAIERAIK